MKNQIRIIRIDPVRQNIVPMTIRIGKNAVGEVKRIVRAKRVGHHKLLERDGVPLVVAAGLDVDEAMKGWRLKGGEDTAGVGILFGTGANGGMIDCPVDVAWVKQRIVWLEGEDMAALQERAEAMLPMLEEDVRSALRAAVDSASVGFAGTPHFWVPTTFSDIFPALRGAGLADELTKGQRLTRLGAAVRALAISEFEAREAH